MYRRRSRRDARRAAGAGRQWLACPARVSVHLPASMSADAVSFPKGVFPPDADFGKGGHVPIKHQGSWGCPEGANRRFVPFGATLLVLFCSRQKRTLLHRRWPSRRAPAKAKELIFQKSLPADARRVHFSTVGGLHGVHPPRAKNLFSKNRFPPTFRRVHFSTVGDRPRRAPAKAKELFIKKRSPPGFPARTAKSI